MSAVDTHVGRKLFDKLVEAFFKSLEESGRVLSFLLSLAFELTHNFKPWLYIHIMLKKLKQSCELLDVSSWFNFQLFAVNSKTNGSNQKLQNCWVAKTLMSPYILCKVCGVSKRISTKLFGILGSNFHTEITSG